MGSGWQGHRHREHTCWNIRSPIFNLVDYGLQWMIHRILSWWRLGSGNICTVLTPPLLHVAYKYMRNLKHVLEIRIDFVNDIAFEDGRHVWWSWMSTLALVVVGHAGSINIPTSSTPQLFQSQMILLHSQVHCHHHVLIINFTIYHLFVPQLHLFRETPPC